MIVEVSGNGEGGIDGWVDDHGERDGLLHLKPQVQYTNTTKHLVFKLLEFEILRAYEFCECWGGREGGRGREREGGRGREWEGEGEEGEGREREWCETVIGLGVMNSGNYPNSPH